MYLNGKVEEWGQKFIERTSKKRPIGGGLNLSQMVTLK
jgi:hypothetical protein